MSSINPVGSSAVNQTSSSTASSTLSMPKVDESEFMKLLVEQLKNQDPMNPMNNQDFIAQLATFSSLEQLQSINKGITSLVDSFQSIGTDNSDAIVPSN
jgi:flagellar basal-body rod modification protein FlgD